MLYEVITMSTPSDIEKGLVDGRFHIGAFPSNSKGAGFDYRNLYSQHHYLYCSNEHPLFGKPEINETDLKQTNAVIANHRMTPEASSLYQSLKCTATASDHEGIAFLILTGTYISYNFV